jgi:hypothetical protein
MMATLASCQAIRYLLVKQLYVFIPTMSNLNDIENKKVLKNMKIIETITSRVTFVIIASVVFVLCYVVMIVFLLVGIFTVGVDNIARIPELISDFYNVVMGILWFVLFILDLVLWIRNQRRQKNLQKMTAFQYIKHYFQDDPLLFRWEIASVFLVFVFGVPTIGIDQYNPSEEEIGLRLTRELLVDAFFFGTMFIYGGVVAVAALVHWIKSRTRKATPIDESALTEELEDQVGFQLLTDYSRSEWSVENIMLYSIIQSCKQKPYSCK